MTFSDDEALATAGGEALAALTSLNRANTLALMHEARGTHCCCRPLAAPAPGYPHALHPAGLQAPRPEPPPSPARRW